MTDRKLVYAFADGFAEGRAEMKDLLGGKGANLAEMCHMGLPVPPGFTLTTEVCNHYTAHDGAFPDGLKAQVEQALAKLSADMDLRFGDAAAPLLVSVRSGSRASMPGMMDTVLNLGLNDATVESLAVQTGDARFAWDSYRRFQQMYGDVVMGVSHDFFEEIIDDYKFENALALDADLDADDWRDICGRFSEMIEAEAGRPFPQDAEEQLWGAIGAVCESWNNANGRRPIGGCTIYPMIGARRSTSSPWCSAISATAAPPVSPSPAIRRPAPKKCMANISSTRRARMWWPASARRCCCRKRRANASGMADLSLEEAMPDTYAELLTLFARLEAHFADMQDIEFTVQQGRLFILQTRTGKRTVKAGLKIAVDMVAEGLIGETEAVLRIEPEALEQLLHPTLDPKARVEVLTKGLPASPGAASGKITFSADRAEAMAAAGDSVVLVRMETSPEDIHGMYAAQAILTSRGGMTSHAAVVARGLGRPCVSGAGQLAIDYDKNHARIGDIELNEGDIITVDGTSGRIMAGEVPTLEPELSGDFGVLMGWADKQRRLQVRTNAETAADAARAVRFGAEGIGLCRTEHMFFDPQRIFNVRQMILAADAAQRQAALDALQPEQQADFAALFAEMQGRPLTIRLLDPPLHEFLPAADDDVSRLAEALGTAPDALKARIAALHETNPMLGHRGSRLAVTAPDVYAMQLRAVFGAMRDSAEAPQVEIMFPLIAEPAELRRMMAMVPALADAYGIAPEAYTLGTMIEVPRAALLADRLAEDAAFFSFGTNDLTQTVFGLSRDDSGSFLPRYVADGLLPRDPFAGLDEDGVGALMRLAAEKGRAVRPDLKLGICGEHGGDPASIAFCEALGLDYVSCSPFRVPIARLAAAQAAINSRN